MTAQHTANSIELRRQSLALADDPAEQEVLDWIEDAADTDGWSTITPFSRHPRAGGDDKEK
jgi:hypothetical protein